jgi:hypothetical protein
VLGEESLDIDTRVRDAALKYLQGGQQQTESANWPFAGVAEERGSTGVISLWNRHRSSRRCMATRHRSHRNFQTTEKERP